MLSISGTIDGKSLHYIVIGPAAAFVNCTPHEITVFTGQNDTVGYLIPASGFVARAGELRIDRGDVDGIPLYEMVYNTKEGTTPNDFPVDPAWSTMDLHPVYIVSLKFIQTLGGEYGRYPILYTPGPAKRDENGNTVGCLGLCRHVSDDHNLPRRIGTPEPDWAMAPRWADWHAYDYDGTGWWFGDKPEQEATFWNNTNGTLAKQHGVYTLGFPWYNSLRGRPEDEE